MIVRRIYEWAHATPDKTAIVYCGIPFNYRGFALRIEHARQSFRQRPLRPGSAAAILADNLFDGWILALALRSLGMMTVAIRSLDEVDGLELEDLGCLVIASERPTGNAPRPRSRDYVSSRIRPGLYFGDAAGEVPDPERAAIVPGTHVLLTSGTTGSYKKARTDDAIEAVRFPFNAALCGFNADSLVCLFDFGLWTASYIQACAVWHVGGGVVLEQGTHIHRPLQLPELTDTVCSPPMLERLMALPRETFVRNPNLSITYGGSAMSWPLAEHILTRLTPNLINHVGSTETGVWTRTRIAGPDDLKSHTVVPSRSVQIVDENDRVLPPGNVGRLRIRNENGITHYLDDAEATQAAFRDGYFYSGDLGLFQPDGRLVLQGRATDVVSIQGNKFAPEPIERALQARLGVEEVCLVSLPVTGAPDEIHVAIQSQRSIDQAALTKAWTSVSSGPQPRFHVIAAVPRNEAGKIQRSVLREQIRAGTL
jgi:acyl-CoA synthetase (AMP-forming)/AMP-acid ligase II